jgi:hypothetical protein
MNPASSNILTSCRMVLRLSGVYLLSFCLISLYDGSMPNLFSIIPLGISGISDICHVKASRFSQRKVMSVSSYLASRPILIQSFLSGLLGSTGTSLSSVSFFLSACYLVGCWLDVEAPYAPFLVDGGRGEPMTCGLGTDDLNEVLLSCVFATLAA